MSKSCKSSPPPLKSKKVSHLGGARSYEQLPDYVSRLGFINLENDEQFYYSNVFLYGKIKNQGSVNEEIIISSVIDQDLYSSLKKNEKTNYEQLLKKRTKQNGNTRKAASNARKEKRIEEIKRINKNSVDPTIQEYDYSLLNTTEKQRWNRVNVGYNRKPGDPYVQPSTYYILKK